MTAVKSIKSNDSYEQFLGTKRAISQNVDRLKSQLSKTDNSESKSVGVEVAKQFDFSRQLTRSQIQRLVEARAYLDDAIMGIWKVGIVLNECDIPSSQFFTGLNLAYAYVSSIDELLSNGYNSRLVEFNAQRVKAANHG
jgi:hypothetical protein